jgi:hypothetical protein
MTDRVMVYDGALPQTTDILNASKFAMVGDAYQNRSLLGTTTVVSGLACLPTSPTPDLHVTIGVGSIYQMDPTDATAYADLGTDNNSIMKQGILAAPVTLTITPPSTGGFSQVFLVQAILNDVDGGQAVLSYYNSANPAAPFSGPANSGTSNYTTRTNPCSIALKAGVAATTGTQVTPNPDAGYVGLYAITVANGATQVTSGNIVQVPLAPFFPTLPSVPGNVQNGSWIYAVDTGAVNALVITPSPNVTALVAGMGFKVKVLVTNTAASTITINYTNTSGVASTLGPVVIKRGNGVGLSASDMVSGGIIDLVYDGTNFQMANYLGTGTNTNNVTVAGIPYIADSGAANAIVATFSPPITYTAGTTVAVKLANTITGACTINANGLGLKNVTLGDITNPPYNVFVAGMVLVMEYDGTQFQILNTSAGMFYRKPTANLSIFVNGAIGNDANDGVSNVSGHALATIGAGVKLAFSYAPSQFTITVVVEPGTYNEAVVTPAYAGPNLIIDGLVASNVVVNSGTNHCFNVSGPNTVLIKNLTIQNNGAVNLNGFLAGSGASLSTLNTVSNTIGGAVFFGIAGGTVFPGTHTFSGSCQSLFQGVIDGICYFGGTFSSVGSPATFTISTSISVSLGSATANGGTIWYNALIGPPTFVNPTFVNGPKFLAVANGTIEMSGLGINFFPGNSAGTSSSGGQYLP